MSITNITPREQELALELQTVKTDRDLWRKTAEDYRRQADDARELLDRCRAIVRDMDLKVLRGAK